MKRASFKHTPNVSLNNHAKSGNLRELIIPPLFGRDIFIPIFRKTHDYGGFVPVMAKSNKFSA